jgi:Na+/proline symporter
MDKYEREVVTDISGIEIGTFIAVGALHGLAFVAAAIVGFLLAPVLWPYFLYKQSRGKK